MLIGIMAAMYEEILSILPHLNDEKIIYKGGRKYHVGKINNQSVVLVFSRWGKVASAITATSLIVDFNVTHIIFTGVAGAASSGLNIGDIVIGNKLYQYDMDARPLMPKFMIPLTDKTFFESDAHLVQVAFNATVFLWDTLSKKIKPSILNEFQISSPKCIIGTIGTGDEFISSSKRIYTILEEQPATIAIEMEGASVAQVCTDYNTPFVIIRIISDKANDEATIDFTKFRDEIATHYSEYIINNMIKSMSNS